MDLIQRGINLNHDIRVVAAISTELVREACRRHGVFGADAVILGRALTAGCLLATLSKKDEERVRIQFAGEGPRGRVLIDARGNGHVRGCFAEPPSEVHECASIGGRPSVADLVGPSGRMMITRDLGLEREYQGIVPLESGEIDRDIEFYLCESEQIPSVLACEVVLDAHQEVLRAGGILCQTLPEADVGQLAPIHDVVHGPQFYELLHRSRTTQELMGFALVGAPFKATEQCPIEFLCTCGPERARSIVSTLGADDIDALADEQDETEVQCTYCGASYTLNRADLKALARQLRRERS